MREPSFLRLPSVSMVADRRSRSSRHIAVARGRAEAVIHGLMDMVLRRSSSGRSRDEQERVE